MKKIILLCAVLMTVVSCDGDTKAKLKESTVQLLTNSISPAISTALECSATAEVRTDVEGAVRKALGAENTAQKSLIGELCKSVVATAVPKLLGAAINPDWKCAATNVQDAIKTVTDGACNKLE